MSCVQHCSFGSAIVFGENLEYSSLLSQYLPKNTSKIAIITDANVAKLHGTKLSASLESLNVPHALFPFPAGEEFKTRKTKERVEDLLLMQGYDRNSVIIGLGGGVVTDIAGFIAATFLRGVPFFAIPTTLMGMVDASIGGKVGINTPFAKNVIGAFYPAKAVFIDTSFLTTLSEKEVQNGMAEVYKYAFIASPEILSSKNFIEQSCLIKQEIVESDFHEQGRRRILNFGHTIGHAIETVSQYKIPHGFAVAAGMRVESYLSYMLGYLSAKDLEFVEHALASFPSIPQLPVNKLLEALCYDKKGSCRCVLLEKIGSPVAFDGAYCTHVQPKLIEQALNEKLFTPLMHTGCKT